MTELSAFASTETDDHTSDSDSDGLESLGDEAEGDQRDASRGKSSWFSKLSFGSSREKYRPLSVQSGDIVHTPPGEVYTGTDHRTTTAAGSTAVVQTVVVVQAREDHQEEVEDSDALTRGHVQAKGGLYAFLFPIVHKVVKFLFFHQRYSAIPAAMIGFHHLLTLMFVLLAVFIYPPAINLTIQAFGIPNHPAQIHWDAYSAGNGGKIWNSTVWNDSAGSSESNNNNYGVKQQKQAHDILKRNIIKGCDRDPNVDYQRRLHIYWELDLVFRVPDGNPDKNVLTMERIKHIHEIEEYIYNHPDYADFCHKSRDFDFCDPINSLLTWLYPRDPQDGSFVYDTPDHFTPNLDESLDMLKNNYTNALWFTGGQVTVKNSTTFVAELLRSQVRVGLPLPCFTYSGDTASDRRRDHYDQENELVTKFFASLIPYLDRASNR